MGRAIRLRADFNGTTLRELSKRSRDGAQARRLIALAEIYDGGRRSDVARRAGVGLQIIRDWVVRFNAEGSDGLINRKGSGPPSRLNDAQRAALKRAVEDGPKPYLHGVVRWRLVDLAQWVWEEFSVSASRQTLGRELRAMGFRRLSARPQHYAQDPEAMEAFKKTSPTSSLRSAQSRVGRRSRFGSRTRRESGRRTRSPAGGRNEEPDLARPTTSAPNGPTSSARSVRPRAKAQGSSCLGPTLTRWKSTSG